MTLTLIVMLCVGAENDFEESLWNVDLSPHATVFPFVEACDKCRDTLNSEGQAFEASNVTVTSRKQLQFTLQYSDVKTHKIYDISLLFSLHCLMIYRKKIEVLI